MTERVCARFSMPGGEFTISWPDSASEEDFRAMAGAVPPLMERWALAAPNRRAGQIEYESWLQGAGTGKKR